MFFTSSAYRSITVTKVKPAREKEKPKRLAGVNDEVHSNAFACIRCAKKPQKL